MDTPLIIYGSDLRRILLVALFLIFAFLAIISADAKGDGWINENEYLLGIDPYQPGLYHRLYYPVMTEGNVTNISASFTLQRAGSGSPRFSVEFLDNKNFALRQKGNTSYRHFWTGSSADFTTSFTTRFSLSLEVGWPNGIYWFCVDKENETTDWCRIEYSVSYRTTEVANGGLIEARFEDLNATILNVSRNVELVDARADSLQGAIRDVELELQVQVLTLQLAIEKANFTQREDYMRRLDSLVSIWDQKLDDINYSLEDTVEEALHDEFRLNAAYIDAALAALNATTEDLDTALRANDTRTSMLEARFAELADALELTVQALNETRADVADLEAKVAESPDDGYGLVEIVASSVVGGLVGAGVVAIGIALRRRRNL